MKKSKYRIVEKFCECDKEIKYRLERRCDFFFFSTWSVVLVFEDNYIFSTLGQWTRNKQVLIDHIKREEEYLKAKQKAKSYGRKYEYID